MFSSGRSETKNITVLSWTSFFEDVSSQMNYSLLPLFLANVLGVNKAFIGLIEGIAETTASFLKVLFGWLSDKLKSRKIFILTGYGITAVSRPFLSIASRGWHVLGLRFLDRSGKGMRTSPRDALIADSCPECERGRAFGFHRAMDTSGAVAGPLLAFFLFSKAGMNYRSIFLISVVPAIVAVLLVLMVREKRWIGAGVQNLQDKSVNEKLPADFKKFLFVLGLFTLGNSSDAFLILRANNVGVSPMFIPILWLTFNSTYAVSSLPSGIASDRIGSKRVITYGFLIYALVYFGFAFASFQYQAWLFFIIYGFYYGLTDGVSRSFVSKMILPQHRATAFGIYHAVVGLIALPASLLMGFLWDWRGPRIAFMFGMSLALISALLLATFNLKEK